MVNGIYTKSVTTGRLKLLVVLEDSHTAAQVGDLMAAISAAIASVERPSILAATGLTLLVDGKPVTNYIWFKERYSFVEAVRSHRAVGAEAALTALRNTIRAGRREAEEEEEAEEAASAIEAALTALRDAANAHSVAAVVKAAERTSREGFELYVWEVPASGRRYLVSSILLPV